MFTDIRGFTPITESLGPQGTVGFLNDYFHPDGRGDQQSRWHARQVYRRRHHGSVRLPIPHDDDEDRATRAAIAMIKTLWQWNIERKAKGQLPADMGIWHQHR